jgi:ribosomal protein L30E
MKKMEEKTKWLIVAVISMLAIAFVISAGVASKEGYMQTSSLMSNTELVSSQSKIDDISTADNKKISDQLAAVIEAEPNSTVEVIVVTTFEVVPVMMQALIDGHHATVEQLGSDKLKVTVVASEIPAISEYEWVESIALTSEVLAGKIGGQLSSVIEAEPNSTVEVIIVTTFEVVPMMSQSLIDGHHAAVEQLESDKLKVTVVASEIPAISEYEWVASITHS